MKRITVLLAFLFAISWQSEAQVLVSENFDSGTPDGWSLDSYFNSTTAACDGQSQIVNIYGSNTSGNLTSPNYESGSNGTDLTVSFDYKILAFGWLPPLLPQGEGWGTADLQYSTDDGENWETFFTIDDSNHEVSADCANVSVVIPAEDLPEDSDVKIRILNTWVSGDYYFSVDNFEANQILSCELPEATTTVVDDCDNNQYTIEIDVTDLGDAEELIITNDLGAPDMPVTETGLTSYGPIPRGTEIALMLEHSSDADCNLDLGTFVDGCPKLNDTIDGDLAEITPSPAGTGCDTDTFNFDFSDGTVTDSGLDADCQGDNTGLDLFFTWTATSDGLTWNDGSGGPGISIRNTDGEEIDCAGSFAADDTQLSGWSIGDELIIQIFDVGTTEANISFCLEELSCPAPSGLLAENITLTTADLSWSADGSATTWEVLWGEEVDLEEDTPVIVEDMEELLLQDLTPGVAYEFYVRAVCGEESSSNWSDAYTFATECEVVTPDYTQSFDEFPLVCWDQAGSGNPEDGPSDLGSSSWFSDEFLNENAASVNIYGSTKSEWLISPVFDLSTGGYELIFMVGFTDYYLSNIQGVFDSGDEIQLLYTDDDGETWNNLETWNEDNVPSVTGDNVTIDISTITGSTVQFAYWAKESEDGSLDTDNLFFIDEFEVRVPPTCNEVNGLSASEETTDSVDLSWEEQEEASDGYNWYIYEEGDVPEDTDPFLASEAPTMDLMVEVIGLNPDTAYEAYVTAVCGGNNGESAYSDAVAFTTEISCFEPENIEFVMADSSSAQFSWDSQEDVSVGYEWFVYEDGADIESEDVEPLFSEITDSEVSNVIVSGLESNTAYDFYLKALCEEEDPSRLTDVLNFRTSPVCGDVFYDNGGSDEDYANNSNETLTIYPENEGDVVALEFTAFDTENSYDGILVYNGEDTSYPIFNSGGTGFFNEDLLDGAWTGTEGNSAEGVTFTSTAESGAITVVFISDSGTTDFGWEANVNCIPRPACGIPEDFAVSNVTGDTADLSWTLPDSDITSFEYVVLVEDGELSNEEDIVDEGLIDSPDAIEFTLTDLEPETSYEVILRTVCSDEESEYTFALSFETTELCAIASDIEIDNITSSSAEVVWEIPTTETDGFNYYLLVEDGDFEEPDDIIVDGESVESGADTVILSDLEPNTTYDFYIETNCEVEGDVISSELSSAYTFTTNCEVFTPDYVESFNEFLPGCWTEAGSGNPEDGPSDFGSSLWGHDGFLNDDGENNSVFINLYTNTREDWLISPEFDLSDGPYELSYIAAITDYLSSDAPPGEGMGSDDEVQVLVSEDGGETWVNLVTYNQDNYPSETGDNEIVDLSEYSGTVQFAIWATDGEVNDIEDFDFFIDEFKVRTPLTCSEVSGLEVSNVMGTSADLSWENNADAIDGYEWFIYEASADLDDPETEPVDSNTTEAGVTSASTELLSEGTSYVFYVEGNCGEGDGTSPLAGPIAFATIPVNDDVCNAIPLIVGDISSGNQYTSAGATDQPNEPSENLNGGVNGSVWFTFVAPASGEVEISTDILGGTMDDSEVAVYAEPTDCADLTTFGEQLGFDQDGGDIVGLGYMSILEISDLVPGDTYYIQVDRYAGSIAGTFGIEVTDATLSTARAQIIHNSPDPAASIVDVYLNGELAVDDLEFRNATEFIDLPADEEITIDIAPSTSEDVSESLYTLPTTLIEGETYIVVADGVLDPSQFDTSVNSEIGFGLEVFVGGQEAALEAGNTDVLVHHGAPDAPAVDVIESDVPVFTDLAYTDFQGYAELVTENYVFDVSGPDGVLESYEANLADLELEGAAIVVLASGFLSIEDNQNGEGFGLWAALASGGALVELPIDDVSTEDFNADNFSFYPNPVRDMLNIKSTSIVDEITVFNMLGQTVEQVKPETANPRLNLENLQSGAYLVKVEIDGNANTFRIIKE